MAFTHFEFKIIFCRKAIKLAITTISMQKFKKKICFFLHGKIQPSRN